MTIVKKMVIVASILLVVGVIGSIVTFNFMDDPAPIAEEKVIDTNDITAINIRANNETLNVIPTKKQTTKVALTGKATRNSKDELFVGVEGNKLSIRTENQRKFFSFDFFTTSLTLTVYLPEKVYESLQVDIDNGHFRAEQLTVNDIKARTNNGQIKMSNIEARTVKVKSDNGKINLEDVEGEIVGKTDNGAISLVTSDLDRPIELESDNGRITIQSDKEPTNATFRVDTDNGDINIFDKYDGDAVIGDGKNVIKLSTDNGRITVAKEE